MDLGVFLLRMVVGLLLAGHGAQKLFGWYDGHGLEQTGKMFHGLGYRPGKVFAAIAGLSEFGGGLLFALGLFTPLAAAAIIGVMFNAVMAVHLEKGPWITAGGYEYNLVLAGVATATAFMGAGALSFDNLLGLKYSGVGAGFLALVLGFGAGIATDAYRRSSQRSPQVGSRDVQATA